MSGLGLHFRRKNSYKWMQQYNRFGIVLRVFSSKNTCLRLPDIVVFAYYTCFLVETSCGIKTKTRGFLVLTWRGLNFKPSPGKIQKPSWFCFSPLQTNLKIPRKTITFFVVLASAKPSPGQFENTL